MAALSSATSRQELLYLFSQYGELREVQEDPLRSNCYLLEFYDTRHAGGQAGRPQRCHTKQRPAGNGAAAFAMWF